MREELYALCREIGLAEEAAAEAASAPDGERLGKLFWDNPETFYETAAREGAGAAVLRAYLELACSAKAEYLNRGISERVYTDTFSDIAVWCAVFKRETGRYGLRQAEWLAHHVRLELFRLGRLQFEPVRLPRAVFLSSRTLPAGTAALNVHIPEGEPLFPDVVEESFLEAERFFPGEANVFVCDSWLLGGNLQKLLSECSNILKFSRRFEIYRENPLSRQAEERIFGRLSERFDAYPEDTFLERAAKRFLLEGGKLGSGEGVYLRRVTEGGIICEKK